MKKPLARRRPPLRRRITFRCLAVALGLMPLLGCEAALALLGWGEPGEVEDPFVGFSEARPLFKQAGDRYEIPPERQEFFRPESFAAEKGEKEYRIFCLGGSTVQGRPYAIETSFTTWLELRLGAADESRDWQVVNCGGVSYASYRLAPLMQELLAYQPDLFILYTGHNEFLEDRSYQAVKETPAAVAAAHNALSHLRTYCVARSAWLRLSGNAPPPRDTLPGEVDAILDYRGGLADYHRDDAWREGVIEHFEFNLRRMVRLAETAGVPLILVNPVCDIADTPPFKHEHRAGLSDAEQERFDDLWRQARENGSERLDSTARLLEDAVAIDGRHAGVRYHLGKTYQALGRHEDARRELIRAKEEDICPLRILEPMNEAILRVAAESGTPLVDVRAEFEERSEGGLPGKKLLIDHVHPQIHGHQLIAELLLNELVREDAVSLQPGWEQRAKDSYREHLASLDQVYYARGEQRLVGLKRWAEGRAMKIRTGAAGAEASEPD